MQKVKILQVARNERREEKEMRRPKNKALRWLRRNCIRIPCAVLVAGTLIIVNRWAYGVPEQETPPVMPKAFAAVEIPDTPVKVAVTAEKEPEEIGSKYCPANKDWADVVSQLMEGAE